MLNLCYQKARAVQKALLTFVKQARIVLKTGGIMITFAVTCQTQVSTISGEVTHSKVLLLLIEHIVTMTFLSAPFPDKIRMFCAVLHHDKKL